MPENSTFGWYYFRGWLPYDRNNLEELGSISYKNSLVEFEEFNSISDKNSDVEFLVSPDSKFLILEHSNNLSTDFVVFDVTSGKKLWETGDSCNDASMSISPINNTLATSCYWYYGDEVTSVIHIWDISNGNELFTLDGYSGRLKYSPDGNLLAFRGDRDRLLYLFDVKSRKILYKLEEIGYSYFFSPDSTLIVSLFSNDSTVGDDFIKVFDVKQGALVLTRDNCSHFILSPDGRFLVTSEGGSHDSLHLYCQHPIFSTTFKWTLFEYSPL